MTDVPTATPPRSQPTRDRILEAARLVFAREGYERATVRLVAAEAAVHPSMITRYYGTKEHLFALAARIDLGLPDVTTLERDSISPALARHFVDLWEGPGTGGRLQALLRASVSHEAARLALVAMFDEQVLATVRRIAGVSRPERSAALIASQLLGIAFSRYVARIPAVEALSADDLVAALGPTIRQYIECRDI
ncbi:transcriptional regulator, TetR family [Sphingomonas gellani]|uniref:Transcriptional regulator, TetR family n=1 Tax=Sphingomonas gellani TaxID=1166340 RepID=A0A1H8CLR8_9SPHN|nr:TetR family transcriptional regulator [Sphingomonas gellani]SEM95228.1 transcriptional regulator, TetR family [Sphingomonas gellani]